MVPKKEINKKSKQEDLIRDYFWDTTVSPCLWPPLPEFINGISSEAWEARVQHETHEGYHLLLVGSDSQVPLHTKLQKPPTKQEAAQVKLWSITVCVNTVVVVGVRSVHHLYGSDFFPPISSSISSVSLRSGSNPRLPPGEDSKRKPKSGSQKHITERIMFSTLFIHTQHSVTYQYVWCVHICPPWCFHCVCPWSEEGS